MKTSKYYLIVPLYQVDVKEEAEGKEFGNGYKIINNQLFHTSYLPNLSDPYKRLYDDTRLPTVGRPIIRAEARYILIKTLELQNLHPHEYSENKELFDKEINFLDLFITSMRLLKAGAVHIYNVYFVSNSSISTRVTSMSTSLYDIDSWYKISQEHYWLDNYNIDWETIQNTLNKLNRLQTVYDKFYIPLLYFNQYHSSYNIYDKIIKLAIVWESTLLKGERSGFKEKLTARGSKLLGENTKGILDLGYKIRSEIIHEGDITSSTLRKIEKITVKQSSSFGTLFNFIKNNLDPLTRKILNKFLF